MRKKERGRGIWGGKIENKSLKQYVWGVCVWGGGIEGDREREWGIQARARLST